MEKPEHVGAGGAEDGKRSPPATDSSNTPGMKVQSKVYLFHRRK